MYIRGRVQLRVWELQDVDEEARIFWSQILGPEETLGDADVVQDSDVSVDDHTSYAGSEPDLDPMTFPPPSLASTSSLAPHSRPPLKRPSVVPTSAARNGFNRPPVFGPDKVVQDPRIQALHRQVMNEVVLVGFLSAMVRVFLLRTGIQGCFLISFGTLTNVQLFSAIVIPIPSVNH